MTAPQHMAALGLANTVRLERARYRREMSRLGTGDGFAFAADAIEENAPALATVRVAEMLTWIYRVGEHRARGIVRRADPEGLLNERATVGGLPPRQREALANYLRVKFDDDGRATS